MKTSEDRAREWFKSYAIELDGAIGEALVTAYKAGFEAGCDEAARVAVRPIMGNGHSSDTLALSRYAVETGRAILDLKGPQYLPPRRLK